MKQRQKITIAMLALAGALGFAGIQLKSTLASPGSETIINENGEARDITIPSGGEAGGAGNARHEDSAASRPAKSATVILTNTPFAGGNPFEQLVKARREAAEALAAAKAALHETRQKQQIEEAGSESRPARAKELLDLNVRAVIEAGEKSTVLVGADVILLNHIVPGTALILEKVANGKAYFRSGAELIEIAPSAKK
ncbi:MAG: hypothetical protein ACKVS6_11850 [Planctomycetota bacterium]